MRAAVLTIICGLAGWGAMDMFVMALGRELDLSGWQCTQSQLVGQSPDRHEVCVQYTRKDKP